MKRSLIGVIGFVLALVTLTSSPATAATPSWSAPQAISTLGNANWFHDIAANENGRSATAVWSSSSNGAGITWASTTNDSGTTWTSRKILYFARSTPEVAVSSTGERIVAVFAINGRILVQRSTNSGASWLPLQQVSTITADLTSEQFVSFDMDASPDAMTLMVTWAGKRVNDVQLLYSSRSTDGGATWSPATLISPARSFAEQPRIDMTADGQRAAIAYMIRDGGAQEKLTSYVRSTADGGQTWSVARKLSLIGHNAETLTVSLADTSGTGWLMWGESFNGRYQVLGVRSENSGRTWTGARTISTDRSAGFPEVQLASDGSRGIAAWLEADANANDSGPFIVASRLDSATQLWSTPVEISAGHGFDGLPWTTNLIGLSASTSGLAAEVSWNAQGAGENSAVMVASTADGGATWTSTYSPAPALTYQGNPKIAVSGDGSRSYLSEVAANNRLDEHQSLYVATKEDTSQVNPNGGGANGGGAAAPVLLEQTATVEFAKTLKRHGWSRVLKLPITTNAGQETTVIASAVVTKSGAKASTRDFKTKVKDNGTANVFKIRLSGRKKLTVSVIVTAPETAVYDDFAVSQGYRMKKSPRWR